VIDRALEQELRLLLRLHRGQRLEMMFGQHLR
jgi:hypothetical protein